MGELIEKIFNNNDRNGSISESYKKNTMFFYEKYSTSTKDVLNIPLTKMHEGGFYFIHYEDDSNWMRYSPIFATSFKRYDKLIIMTAVNFNFIPLEVRAAIFDKYITKNDMEKNNLLKVDHKGMYNELLRYGYEYALVEYNLAQIKSVHFINMALSPQFLYSGHPINVYDPKKLYDIWRKKLETREKRHQEMMKSIISDFYDISNEIDKNYEVLRKHIDRIKKSYEKYG